MKFCPVVPEIQCHQIWCCYINTMSSDMWLYQYNVIRYVVILIQCHQICGYINTMSSVMWLYHIFRLKYRCFGICIINDCSKPISFTLYCTPRPISHTLYRMGVFFDGCVIYLFKFEKCYRFGYKKFKLTIERQIKTFSKKLAANLIVEYSI